MALFDFLRQQPSINPALEEQLRKRGRTDLLPELRPRSTASFFRQEFSQNLAKGAVVGRKLAEGVAGAIAAPEIRRIEEQNLKAKTDLLESIKREAKKGKLTPERRERLLKMAENIDVDASKEIPELQISNKQIIGSAGELALLAATGYKPGAQGLIPSGRLAPQQALKTIKGLREFNKAVKAEERIRKLGPTAGRIANVAAKRLPQLAKDAAGGGLFFGAAEASRGGSQQEIARQAAIGTGIGAAAPMAFEGAIRAIGAGGKFIGRKVISPLASKAMRSLEKAALPTLKKGEGLTETERTLSVIPSRFQGVKQQAAKKTLAIVSSLKKLPSRITDRFSVFKRIEDKIIEMKGGKPLAESEKVYRDARLTIPAGEAKAEQAAIRLFGDGKRPGIMTPYKDIEDKVVARLLKLDAIDRTKLGQKVASGETTQQLEEGLQRLVREAGADNPRVVEAVDKWNRFQRSLLQQRVNAGLIDQATVTRLVESHPNYIPHRVVFELDEQIIQQVGRGSESLNVPATDILRAKGSERALEDPFVAALQNLPRAFGTMEKNKTLITLVENQEKYGMVEGMKPLQTAARVIEQRKAFEELFALRQELQNIKNSVGFETGVNKSLNTKILAAEKRIEELYSKGINKTVAQEDEVLFNLLKKEVEHARSVATGKTLTGPLPRTAVLSRAQVNQKILNEAETAINASSIMNEPSKAKLLADLKKGLAREGDINIPENITGSQLKKQLQEIIRTNRETKIEKFVSKYKAGKIKGEGLAERTTTAFGKYRPILKQKFTAFKTEEIVKQSEKRLDQLLSSLNTKETQINSVLEEIKNLSALKKGTTEQTINVFRNGIKETWVVPADIATAVKNLDNQAMDTVMKALTAPTRLLKALATRFNLSFTLPNKLRDKQTAFLTADAFIQDMIKRSGADVGGGQFVASQTDDQLYKLWKESGGAFGSIFREGRPSAKTVELYKKGGWIQEYSNKIRPDKLIDNLNTTIEESTRLEVFKKALSQGLSPKDAALVARDATIDFAKMGTWMRNLNEIVPFLNARVQGALNIFRAGKLGPEQFARAQMWTSVYPTMAVYAHNRQFESSKNIPQYFYEQYWPIMIGEQEITDDSGATVKVPQFITIRKGEGQQLVANPLMWWLRQADGTDPRRVGQMITNTIGQASPVDLGVGGFGEKNIFLSFVSQFGPLANIAVGLGTNVDPFTGQQIVPESRLKASPELQVKKSTPQLTRDLAGIIGVSPARMAFVLNSFGGVPQDVQELANLAAGAAEGEGLRTNPLTETKTGQASKLPVLRRFVRESEGFGSAIQESQKEFKSGLERQIIDKRLGQKDQAAEVWDRIKGLPKQQQSAYLRSIKASPKLVADLKQLKKNRTAFEVLTPNDSAELRARYIYQRIKEMEAQGVSLTDRRKFLRELQIQKIYTDAVAKLFKKLQRGREID